MISRKTFSTWGKCQLKWKDKSKCRCTHKLMLYEVSRIGIEWMKLNINYNKFNSHEIVGNCFKTNFKNSQRSMLNSFGRKALTHASQVLQVQWSLLIEKYRARSWNSGWCFQLGNMLARRGGWGWELIIPFHFQWNALSSGNGVHFPSIALPFKHHHRHPSHHQEIAIAMKYSFIRGFIL